jgi:hypothetical protein
MYSRHLVFTFRLRHYRIKELPLRSRQTALLNNTRGAAEGIMRVPSLQGTDSNEGARGGTPAPAPPGR